jgi:uncharacterized membrane protein YadS
MSVQTDVRDRVPRSGDVVEVASPQLRRWYDSMSALMPGLLLVVALGLAARALAAIQEAAIGRAWLEALVLALLLGVLVRNVVPSLKRCDAGAAYAGKQVLDFAVVGT